FRATGSVKGLVLGRRGAFTLTVRDMTYELTKLPLFQNPPHSSVTYAAVPLLMPVGIIGASYGTVSPSADLAGTVSSPVVIALNTVANAARVDVANSSVAGKRDNFVTSQLVGAVTPNVRPNLISPFDPGATPPTFGGIGRVH